MHRDPEGETIRAQIRCARFVAVHDRSYDPIRRMAVKADRVAL
jgi:hypothetical protein